MTERNPHGPGARKPADWGFEEARKAASLEGLRMTPAERLRWLEETMTELQALLGRARDDRGRLAEDSASR